MYATFSALYSSNGNYKMFLLVLFFLLTAARLVSSSDSIDLLDRMLKKNFPKESFEYVPECQKELSSSWLLRPPFITNSSGNGHQIGGIFHDILHFALKKCCDRFGGGNNTRINYTTQAANRSMLHEDILKDEVDLILPVQSDDSVEYKGYLPYLKILDSPGIVLIQRSDSIQQWSDKSILLWNAISSCWPIVVLTLLLSLAAGIVVWAMEKRKNNKEFGGPFYRGIFDGFWWAFVTMSTVGYGDKTPKSIKARLFSVMWIMIGITICSILTATLSSALTNVTVERFDVVAGMKVGATRDSIALQKAVNLGANVIAFKDLDEVYNALVNEQSVDGMMEEMFIAMEYMKQKDNSLIYVVHLFEEKHGYGVALKVWNELSGCMSLVVQFVTDDIYSVTHRYGGSVKKSGMDHAHKDAELLRMTHQKSPVFIGTAIGLCGFAVLFFTNFMMLKYFRGRRVKHIRETVKGLGMTSNNNSQNLSDGIKRLELIVTELVKVPFTKQNARDKYSF